MCQNEVKSGSISGYILVRVGVVFGVVVGVVVSLTLFYRILTLELYYSDPRTGGRNDHVFAFIRVQGYF